MSLEENTSFQAGLNDSQIQNISIVYVASLSLSLLGSFSIVAVSISKRRHLNEQACPMFQLALADFLASALLLGTNTINFVPNRNFTYRISFCECGLPLAVAFYGISFLLVMVYAYKSKQTVQGWRERREGRDGQLEDRQSNRLRVVYAAVWFAPITICCLYLGLMETRLRKTSNDTVTKAAMSNDDATFCTSCILLLHMRNDSCHPVDNGHDIFVKSFFFVSGLVVPICCIVMYCKVGSWYRKYKEQGLFLVEGDGFDRRNLRGLYSTARNMVLVIIFCWTPVFVLASLSFIEGIPQGKLYPLYVIQALTISLQGLLDSIVYGWFRRNFREAALGERIPFLANSPGAFYDESLTSC